SFYLSIYLSIFLLSIHPFNYLSIYLFIFLLSIHPSIHPSYPSIHPSILSIHPSIHPIHPSIHPSIQLSIYLSIYLSILPSIHLNIPLQPHSEVFPSYLSPFSSQEYEPTIFYPKRSSNPLYRDFTTQCEKMDIPFLSYLPTEVQLISDAYNLVIDALLGVEDSPSDPSEPYYTILATLKHIRVPLISLDVPSGMNPLNQFSALILGMSDVIVPS
uniref:YjeF N-terminal domain-containing protein n=1 Tax=Salvator merianae TaxID=96440 RepID=A0A8D0B3N4_SALMN